MNTSVVSTLARWTWRGVTLLALLVGLAFAPAASAEFEHSTITVHAPKAPAGAWVSVQWQDLLGSWHDVEGWQAELDMADDSNLAFKQWAVYSQDYGRGPFRWVIYTEQDGAVWATSPRFYLPDGDGADLTMTLASKVTLPSAEIVTSGMQAEFGHSTITAHAPDAPAGAWVSVQWQDLLGSWHDVEGWQAELDMTEDSNLASKQWAVYSQDYGRGPFRWVIYTERGGAVWATSPRFYLPDGDGADLTMTLAPKIALPPAETIAAGMQTEALTLGAQSTIGGLNCGANPCNHSVITVYVPEAPAGSRIGVQWQDGRGAWHDVRNWQGNLDLLKESDTPFKQWTVTSDTYGRGPFRWVIYTETGDAVWGVSPTFTLPERDGLDLSLVLSP